MFLYGDGDLVGSRLEGRHAIYATITGLTKALEIRRGFGDRKLRPGDDRPGRIRHLPGRETRADLREHRRRGQNNNSEQHCSQTPMHVYFPGVNTGFER
jgi:hypothetical protein